MKALALLVAGVMGCAAPIEDGAAGRSPEGLAEAAAEIGGATQPSAVASGAVALSASFPSTLLDRYDFERRTSRFDLPGRLDEISGLAFTPDGRLFGHDDERGRVHEIDPGTGEVGKRFDLGEEMARGDFEGIAIAGERFFLISSRGLLYEFREAGDRESAPYRRTDTGVGASCEVEGLDYDPTDDALLIACKVASPDRGTIVVHRVPLDPTRTRIPSLMIPREQLSGLGLGEEFHASAIAVDPTGTFVLIAARQESLIEVDRDGRVVSGLSLSNNRHPQAEGLAFGPDGTLYIADERNGGNARLTTYARVEGTGAGSR